MLGGRFAERWRVAACTTERISMAKKAELLEKAAELQLAVSDKNTIAEIEAAIAEAESGTPESSKPQVADRKSVV